MCTFKIVYLDMENQWSGQKALASYHFFMINVGLGFIRYKLKFWPDQLNCRWSGVLIEIFWDIFWGRLDRFDEATFIF